MFSTAPTTKRDTKYLPTLHHVNNNLKNHNHNSNNNNNSNNNINSTSSKRDRIYRSFSRQVPGQTRWLTREIAALDFLLNIPLQEEREIVKAGLEGRTYIHRRKRIVNHDQNHPPVAATASSSNHPNSSNHNNNGGNPLLKNSNSLLDLEKGLAPPLSHSDIAASNLTTPLTSNVDLTTLIPAVSESEVENVNVNNAVAVAAVEENMTLHSSNSSGKANKETQPRWWEKFMLKEKNYFMEEHKKRETLKAQLELEEKELELPTTEVNKAAGVSSSNNSSQHQQSHSTALKSFPNSLHSQHSNSQPQILLSQQPNVPLSLSKSQHTTPLSSTAPPIVVIAPGRRLEGRPATVIKLPTVSSNSALAPLTRQKAVARNAAIREWEIRVAHGIGHKSNSNSNLVNATAKSQQPYHNNNNNNPSGQGLLDGRIFFSAQKSYPIGVFSVIKYEPQKEEAARRRKKLEEMGGGGTQFAIPPRDWRGTSYRALLRRVEKKNKSFKRFMEETRKKLEQTTYNDILLINDGNASSEYEDGLKELPNDIDRNLFKKKKKNRSNYSSEDDDDDDSDVENDISTTSSSSSSSSSSSGGYVAGFLDDPSMVQGRHRHVMFGDRNTGPIVSSTIQFVKPAVLKANLNKRFRERFDGWEPPKKHWGLIGAEVIDGVYTLMDNSKDNSSKDANEEARTSALALSGEENNKSSNTEKEVNIRMPPSLTLSKIRSIKQQALVFCVMKANLEVSTVALACVYFERLCLDCRVDKSNRRVTFASCLLLSVKINEANVKLEHNSNIVEEEKSTNKAKKVLHAFVRPTKRSGNMFASLLEFFTNEWNLNLQNLFAAEWGVFAALGFRLHVSPSHVAVHFKRLMKVLEKIPLNYIGLEMYNQWQTCLMDDDLRRKEHDARKRKRQDRKERKLIRMQRNLQMQSDSRGDRRMSFSGSGSSGNKANNPNKTTTPQKINKRMGNRRNLEQDKDKDSDHTQTQQRHKSLLTTNKELESISTGGGMSHHNNKLLSPNQKRKSRSIENLSSLPFQKKDKDTSSAIKHASTNLKKPWSRWLALKPHHSHSVIMDHTTSNANSSSGTGTSSPFQDNIGGTERYTHSYPKKSSLKKSVSSSVLNEMTSTSSSTATITTARFAMDLKEENENTRRASVVSFSSLPSRSALNEMMTSTENNETTENNDFSNTITEDGTSLPPSDTDWDWQKQQPN